MRRVELWAWSILFGSATACGARTELDVTGFGKDTELGPDAVDAAATETGTTLPPSIHPTTPIGTVIPPVGTERPIPSAPIATTTPPTVIIPPAVPQPCVDGAPGFLRKPREPLGDALRPPSICGDGFVSRNDVELCDDGNNSDGDGCDSTCMTEQYFDCPNPNSPCVRIEVCGDSVLGETEYCDDGNTTGGDGCSPSCQIEVNAVCEIPGQPCKPAATCGNGVVTGAEQCDRPYSPGCLDDCTVEPGWVCPVGYPCFTRCGDGISVGSEQCDDGNRLDGDGCDSSCSIEWEYCLSTGKCGHLNVGRCGNAIRELGEGCDDGAETDFCTADCQTKPQCDAGGCLEVCGDGILQIYEECDDGNIRVDDGCSQCQIEPGHACTVIATSLPPQEPGRSAADAGSVDGLPPDTKYISVCWPTCGNGLQQRGEECDPLDPETRQPNGICNTDCTLADAYCGNGIVEGDETCDDGLNRGEAFGECPPGCRLAQYCGDGIVQPHLGETCDLGKALNSGAYQTCTSSCQLAAHCGDGVLQACGREECDDGNRRNGDGCSVACLRE